MSVAKKIVAWLDTKPEEWIDAQNGLGEIYAEAQVEAAQHGVQQTAKLCPHCNLPLIEGACPGLWELRESLRR